MTDLPNDTKTSADAASATDAKLAETLASLYDSKAMGCEALGCGVPMFAVLGWGLLCGTGDWRLSLLACGVLILVAVPIVLQILERRKLSRLLNEIETVNNTENASSATKNDVVRHTIAHLERHGYEIESMTGVAVKKERVWERRFWYASFFYVIALSFSVSLVASPIVEFYFPKSVVVFDIANFSCRLLQPKDKPEKPQTLLNRMFSKLNVDELPQEPMNGIVVSLCVVQRRFCAVVILLAGVVYALIGQLCPQAAYKRFPADRKGSSHIVFAVLVSIYAIILFYM
ncbi:MAG: hypothetical protein ACRC46_07275 [Thermoguttaceae bacterium]